jgi:transposase-like protein
MRTFKCSDCEYTWQLLYGAGGRGIDLTCPRCGSRNIHRVKTQSSRSKDFIAALESLGCGRHHRGHGWK